MKTQQKLRLAQIGHPKHLSTLIKDPVSKVRSAVAECGNDKHRDMLIKDPHPWVRESVAIHGNQKHKNILKDDDSSTVRHWAREDSDFKPSIFDFEHIFSDDELDNE